MSTPSEAGPSDATTSTAGAVAINAKARKRLLSLGDTQPDNGGANESLYASMLGARKRQRLSSSASVGSLRLGASSSSEFLNRLRETTSGGSSRRSLGGTAGYEDQSNGRLNDELDTFSASSYNISRPSLDLSRPSSSFSALVASRAGSPALEPTSTAAYIRGAPPLMRSRSSASLRTSANTTASTIASISTVPTTPLETPPSSVIGPPTQTYPASSAKHHLRNPKILIDYSPPPGVPPGPATAGASGGTGDAGPPITSTSTSSSSSWLLPIMCTNPSQTMLYFTRNNRVYSKNIITGLSIEDGIHQLLKISSDTHGDLRVIECGGSAVGSSTINNDVLALGTSKGIVQIWDVRTRQKMCSFNNGLSKYGEITALRFNGQLLTIATTKGTIRHYDTRVDPSKKTKESGISLSNAASASSMITGPSSGTAGSSSMGSGLGASAGTTGSTTKKAKVTRHQARVGCLEWNVDGRILASGDDAGMVYCWDLAGKQSVPLNVGEFVQRRKKICHNGGVSALAWCPWQPSLLASGDTKGTIKLWNINPSSTSQSNALNPGTLDLEAPVTGLHWSPQCKEILSTHGAMDRAAADVASASADGDEDGRRGHRRRGWLGRRGMSLLGLGSFAPRTQNANRANVNLVAAATTLMTTNGVAITMTATATATETPTPSPPPQPHPHANAIVVHSYPSLRHVTTFVPCLPSSSFNVSNRQDSEFTVQNMPLGRSVLLTPQGRTSYHSSGAGGSGSMSGGTRMAFLVPSEGKIAICDVWAKRKDLSQREGSSHGFGAVIR